MDVILGYPGLVQSEVQTGEAPGRDQLCATLNLGYAGQLPTSDGIPDQPVAADSWHTEDISEAEGMSTIIGQNAPEIVFCLRNCECAGQAAV